MALLWQKFGAIYHSLLAPVGQRLIDNVGERKK